MTIKKTNKHHEHSLAELRKINIGVYEQHNKLNQIIDVRKQEVDKLREQLYVEVQNFREAHAAEVRRSIEWSVDMANRSLPWWKRSIANIRDRANAFMVQVQDMVKIEVERIQNEVAAAQNAEREKAERDRKEAEKALGAIPVVPGAGTGTKPPVEESAGTIQDDGYGRPMNKVDPKDYTQGEKPVGETVGDQAWEQSKKDAQEWPVVEPEVVTGKEPVDA